MHASNMRWPGVAANLRRPSRVARKIDIRWGVVLPAISPVAEKLTDRRAQGLATIAISLDE
jgi:hypothetical protein